MALVVKDRVKVTTTTTGTSDFTLGSAALGFQSFSVIGDGNETYYAAVDTVTGSFEVGIGTFTAAGPTLTRTTILESSAAGAKVSFGAGSKDLFVTYPAERSVYLDIAGSYPVQNTFNALNATTATLTNGTVSTTPASGTDIANKTYVDTVAAQGITYHSPVFVESPNTAGNLNATYNNGTSGVGATLTNAGTQVALTIDGVLMTTTKRVLIYNQTNAAQNGVYTVTVVGTGATNWVLTRATDADTYAVNSPTSLGQGDAFFVTNGNTGAGELYVMNTVGVITFGTTAINFTQISASIPYLAGTGLNLSPSTTFNISNVGTAGTYGSSSNVPVFVTNAQGQVTSVTNTGIAITSAAVSGLAASATTDTTNAANISSGTLPSARISGSYTGLTGTGALAAGSLATGFTAVGATLGGTGLTSYAVGDILYASTTTALSKLADVAVGNALISGGVGSAPSWGKVGLATHVSGTLPVANGGTGVTSSTGTGSVVLSSSPTLVTPALGTPSALVGTNITGTATGLSIGGNAGTATTLQTARTINSVSFNGSANILVNTNNALTFNTGGAGVASGATFNGSAAATISYNTILGFLPVQQGGGTSQLTNKLYIGWSAGSVLRLQIDATDFGGVWPIGITGNAATVTNGVYTSTDQTIGGNKTFSNTILGSISGTTGTFTGGIQSTSQNGGQLAGLRNKIINGNMSVAQRGTVPFTVSLPAAGSIQYTADRFGINQSTAATSAVAVGGIISDNALGGSSSTHIYLQTSTAKATLAAGDYALIKQNIEGLNVADLKYGTASAKTVTISFRAVISNGGSSAVVGVSIRNSGASRSYVVPVTITNTAATYSVTIPGDTTGTWLKDSGIGMQVGFCAGSGTTYQTTGSTWTAGNFIATSTQTNVLATATAALNITDVQLEVGPVATPFEQRPYGMELALCQRYFQKSYQASTAPGTNSNLCISSAYAAETTRLVSVVNRFPVVMRATPTVQIYSETGSAGLVSTTGGVNAGSTMIASLIGDAGFGEITGTGLTINTTYRAHWTASVEL